MLLENKLDEYEFLYESALEFISSDFLKPHEKMNLGFNITKYYIVLMRNFLSALNVKSLEENYPKMYAWSGFCKTPDFQEIIRTTKQELQTAEMKF